MRSVDAGRWCLDCAKCTEHLLFSAALGGADPGMDVDRLLSRSDQVTGLAVAADDTAALPGNAAFDARTGTPSHFTSFCHSLHRVSHVAARAVARR